jgi:hypothetical protein
MGMQYTFVRDRDITPDNEIQKIELEARPHQMRLLSKDVPATWWNGPGSSIAPSNLDHVVAADHLKFTQFDGADVTVLGWPKLPTPAEQGEWIDQHSDHGLLYFEVLKA